MIYTILIKNNLEGHPVVVVYAKDPLAPIREDWVVSISHAGRPGSLVTPEVWGPSEYRDIQQAVTRHLHVR